MAQARAVLAWAAAGGHRVQLYTLPEPAPGGAAIGMGAPFWVEVMRLLSRDLVIDCGSAAGNALTALRAGARQLRFQVDAAQQDRLCDLAAAHRAMVVAAPPDVSLTPARPVAAQLGRWRIERAGSAWSRPAARAKPAALSNTSRT